MIKQKLIEARKRKNLSQESIANALHIDVSNYNRREKGEIKITTEQWQKLSKVLETPLEELYEAEESQIFIFNDHATGNVNSTIHYNIPLSLWETQKKYIKLLEEKINKLS